MRIKVKKLIRTRFWWTFFFLLINTIVCQAQITDLQHDLIMPGLIHHQFTKHLPRGPVKVHILEANLKKGFALKPALAKANTIWAKATVPEIVSRERAIAGINANYFNSRGMPIGSLAIGGEWITSPVLRRASVSVDTSGHLQFARLSVNGYLKIYRRSNYNSLKKITTHPQVINSIHINSINQLDSLNRHGISFYNHWWQDQVLCGQGRACILIDGNGIVRKKVTVNGSINPIYPTRTDYVLSARSDHLFSDILLDDQVYLSWTSDPDWSNILHAIGGGPYLLSKGQIIMNDKLEGFTQSSGVLGVAPRTALGVTKQGRLIFLTADGRQANSVGLTLWELATLMKEIGAYEALNLDGGGSTTMVAENQILNHPSGTLRKVSTALLLYKTPPY